MFLFPEHQGNLENEAEGFCVNFIYTPLENLFRRIACPLFTAGLSAQRLLPLKGVLFKYSKASRGDNWFTMQEPALRLLLFSGVFAMHRFLEGSRFLGLT